MRRLFRRAPLTPESHLKVMDYNRVVMDLNCNTPEDYEKLCQIE